MVSKLDFKKFQQKAHHQWKLLKSRPEMAISLIAVMLLVIGVFSAVLLTGVEQDIRQQAKEAEYGGEGGTQELVQPIEVNGSENICTKETCTVWGLSK